MIKKKKNGVLDGGQISDRALRKSQRSIFAAYIT